MHRSRVWKRARLEAGLRDVPAGLAGRHDRALRCHGLLRRSRGLLRPRALEEIRDPRLLRLLVRGLLLRLLSALMDKLRLEVEPKLHERHRGRPLHPDAEVAGKVIGHVLNDQGLPGLLDQRLLRLEVRLARLLVRCSALLHMRAEPIADQIPTE